jgi:hypothetical protein
MERGLWEGGGMVGRGREGKGREEGRKERKDEKWDNNNR